MLALAIASPCESANAAPPPTAARDRGEAYTFAFHEAAITQAADAILGQTLGLTYTVDPEVTGKISFRIDQRMTRAQLLEAFEAALAANGVVMVRSGESLSLVPRAKAKESAGLHTVGEGGDQAAGYEVVAVPLTYATPSEVAKALGTMGRADMVIYTDDKLGLMLLGGTAREIEAAQQALKVLDQSGLQSSKMRWYELEHAPAQTVAQEIQQILTASGAAGIGVVPLKRLNGILVFARTPQGLDEVGRWIDKLDTAGKEEVQDLWVYRPLNLTADALASTLNTVLNGAPDTGGASGEPSAADQGSKSSGASPATPVQTSSSGGFSASGENTVRVGVNRESNTLIITAAASKWVQIKKILDQVDRPPDQVLIEASILEVTLSDELQFGVDWSVVGASGKLTATSAHNAGGLIAPTFPGLSVTYLAKDIQAAVSALKSVTAVEVVSAPRMVTIDNHTAKLQVGDQVPVTIQAAQSTSTAGAPLISTTEYRDTGVILNVTPRISGDDQVILDVDQTVSSVAKTTSSGIDSPTIQQRHLSSTLILTDGGTVALGGLISTSKTKGNSGLPFFKDIPVLGQVFRANDNENRRTELIVLISVKIMKDAGSTQRVMHDLEADMREIQAHGLFGH